MSDRIALVDVDGVVIDLMGGLNRWHMDTRGHFLDLDRVMVHDDLGPVIFPLLVEFMQREDCYKWCDPCPGAVEGIKGLVDRGFKVVFNTAIMKSARGSYVSKYERLEELLGETPFEYMATPSAYKWLVQGTIGIDDRADICLQYAEAGTFPFLIARRWSFKPDLTLSDYDDALVEMDLDGYVCVDRSELKHIVSPQILGSFDKSIIEETIGEDVTAWHGLLDALDNDVNFGGN